jgi:phage terminase Nu1 subunit (DNA packaging protein)
VFSIHKQGGRHKGRAAGPSKPGGHNAKTGGPEFSHERSSISGASTTTTMPKNGTLAPLTRVEAARLLGISPRTFDDAIRPRLPLGGTTGKGKDLRFDAAAVVAAFVEYRLSQHKPAEVVADPLMSAPEGSPALERYRAARADTAEMERDRMRGDLAPVSELDAGLTSLAQILRSGIQTLQRQCGPEAAAIMNESIDEWERALAQTFGEPSAAAQDPPEPQQPAAPKEPPPTAEASP